MAVRRVHESDANAPGAVSRREFLALAGVAALAGSGCAAVPWAAGDAPDHDVDVAVVGGGAAGAIAAVVAAEAGARVVLLEKAPLLGGTTAKSGGVYWIPNNRFERERGAVEPRQRTLERMARASYPQRFRAGEPRFGVPEREWSLLEAFYDNASPAVEALEAMGALHSMPADGMVGPLPDYWDDRREGPVVDRRLWPRKPDGSFGLGDEMMRQLRAGLAAQSVPVLLSHRVARLARNARGEVVGLEAERADGGAVRVRARRAVVFGSGGYTHDPDLVLQYQPGPIHGGCAVPTNQGDFIRIAQAVGASLGNMASAWRAQIVLEQALQFASTPDDVFMPPGDSMVLVNRLGRRVVNEKTNYNERTRAHLVWDAARHDFSNALLFMVYDRRTAELYAGRYPLPPAGTTAPYVISGDTFPVLASALDARLERLAPRTGGVRLDAGFASALAETVARFDRFARAGVDADFARGERLYDREWHSKIWSFPNPGTPWKLDQKNPTLHPFAARGPYFAIVLGSGTLDTNGGPLVNARAQVLDAAGAPIPGLYGAGNCIASPTGPAYYAGGGTLGPLVAFAWLAGRNAAAEPPKELT
jgi:succinate dehydrogenase/fumarate reductase flavoprotein subunit